MKNKNQSPQTRKPWKRRPSQYSKRAIRSGFIHTIETMTEVVTATAITITATTITTIETTATTAKMTLTRMTVMIEGKVSAGIVYEEVIRSITAERRKKQMSFKPNVDSNRTLKLI